MKLHIVDCSNYLYAGAYSNSWISRGVREVDGYWKANEAPIGAIKFLLSRLREMVRDDTVVIPVMERAPHIKREMYYKLTGDEFGYKAGRGEKPAHYEDIKDYAEWIMRDLGFPVQYAEGYEADDVIYTLVELYKYDFEKIYVHTKDSDLFFLVSDNVEISRVGDKGKIVTMENYERVAKTGEEIWYNTIHLHKLYKGDPSDHIPGVGRDWASRVDSVLKPEDFANLGDLDLTRERLREASIKYAECENSHILVPTFNLIVPLRVPNELIDFSDMELNMEKYDYYYQLGFEQKADKWNLEDMLNGYINKFYE